MPKTDRGYAREIPIGVIGWVREGYAKKLQIYAYVIYSSIIELTIVRT